MAPKRKAGPDRMQPVVEARETLAKVRRKPPTLAQGRKPTKPKNEQSDIEIGERVRYARVEILKMKQHQFATKLGVTRGAVANWEKGKGVKSDNLLAICRRFSISIEWMLIGRGLPRPNEGSLEERMELLPRDEYERFYEEVSHLLTMRLNRLSGGDDQK